jgi:hypothetical protein
LTWIEATGQRWKLHVFFALMAVTFVLLFALMLSFGTGDGNLPIIFGIAMIVFALGAHLWIALHIQCASCHRRIGWLVLSAMGTRWLAQLWRGEVCPSCGDSGVPTPR